MPHVPHVYIPPPWPAGDLPLGEETKHHLGKVMRRTDGAAVSYTDGAGTVGTGKLLGGVVSRGAERLEPARTPILTVAVAPPHRTERARWLVEKLGELGVDRLLWLETARAEGRPPRPDKAAARAVAALEQSRGSRLLAVEGPVPLDTLDLAEAVVADRSGGSVEPAVLGAPSLTLVIGPEGGLDPGELARFTHRMSLGPRVLRTETAAVVGAALIGHLMRTGG